MVKSSEVDRIVKQAQLFGADLAGVASVAALRDAPSYKVFPKLPVFDGTGIAASEVKDVAASLSGGIRSLVVLAVKHPGGRPELDDWVPGLKGGTEGNRLLMNITAKLAAWITGEMGMPARDLAYHVERGGVFLKDAAVLAGIGSLGRSNLLLTPAFGPRVRLRVVAVEADLPATGPLEFDPCVDCPGYCRDACPEKAFSERIYDSEQLGVACLPGREGSYSRVDCNQRMKKDQTLAAMGGPGDEAVRYCRRCELACPVGRSRRG